MSSVSEGFVLRKVTSFAATMGLILATIANLPHSASAANRGGLWAVVHGICVPAYPSIGVGFPCAGASLADGPERGFAGLRAPSYPGSIRKPAPPHAGSSLRRRQTVEPLRKSPPRTSPAIPLRIRLRKSSASKVAGFYSATRERVMPPLRGLLLHRRVQSTPVSLDRSPKSMH